MLNIVMPMAERGLRLMDAGCGQALLKVVIDNLRPGRAHRFIFVVLQEHIEAFGLDGHLGAWAPGCVIVAAQEAMEGAPCAALLAREHIHSDEPLMIAACDQWIDMEMEEYLEEMDKGAADGLIMTMAAEEPGGWCCRFDGAGRMIEVAERQGACKEATAGIFGFRRGRDFVAAAEAMIAGDRRVKGGFSIGAAYNELLTQGRKIAHYNVGRERESVFRLGIAGDLELFKGLAGRAVARLMRLAKIEGRAAILNRLGTAVGRSRDTKVTFHERPIYAQQIGTVSDPMRRPTRCGIVLQGPIRREEDFTLNTVRLYRRHFPAAEVVVSTWDDEEAGVLEGLRGAGATVLTSAPPTGPSPFHVNHQIVSSFAGVKWCCEKGLAYVLKTRADQRFYAPNAVEFMAELLAAFPVKAGFAQKARILGISLDTFKYRLYGLSDHLVFGTSEDMRRFWGVPQDVRPVNEPVNPTWNEASLRNIVEVYFVTEFLKAIGRPVTWTLEDSLAAYGEHFCVIDTDDIDFYWPKYEAHKERRMVAYDAIKNTQELTFRDWLLLQRGCVDVAKIPQAGLHVPYGGRIY